MNGFLIFPDDDMADRFLASSEGVALAERSVLTRSAFQPFVIVEDLPDHLFGFVTDELAPEWSARFELSRRYSPVGAV